MSLVTKLDFFDPAVMEDPYPTYAELRRAGQVCRGGPAQWVVSRYDDVQRLMTDRRLSGNFSGLHHRLTVGEGPASRFFKRIVLNQDPPVHTRIRRLMGQAISPSLVRDITPCITEIVDALVEPAVESGRFDAVGDLGYPLPLRVLCELVAIGPDQEAEVGRRAIEVSQAFANILLPAERSTTDSSVQWLHDFIAGLLEERKHTPGNDLLSRLLAAEEHGDHLTDEEIIENVVFTLFAGFETSTSLIANGCVALLEHPDQLERLRANPALVPLAVEEFLRWDAPIQVKMRLVREPIEVGDQVIRPNRIVVLLLGSANHDEEQFERADRLDVGREHNPHVTFGGGHHRCIGAALARLEARIAFDALVRRFSTWALDGVPVRQAKPAFRIYDSVPLAATPA